MVFHICYIEIISNDIRKETSIINLNVKTVGTIIKRVE